MSSLASSNLFKPLKVGKIILENRIAHAPTSRLRATGDHVVTDSMLEYYTQRAQNNGGLLVLDGSTPTESFGYFPNIPIAGPGRQLEALKKIADSIHANGSYAVVQLSHLGRSTPLPIIKAFNLPFVGASTIYIDEENKKNAAEQGLELKELTKEEIKSIVEEFAAGAKRVINEAGFDLIEIHAGYMFLIDQFLQESSNQRTDEYGGSIENRARFLLEIVDACTEAVGADRVAIRLTPYATMFGGLGIKSRINPIVTWGYVLSELQKRADEGKEIAYVSLVEPRSQGENQVKDELATSLSFEWPRLLWKGVLMKTGDYLEKENYGKLQEAVNGDDKLLIGVARYYTSNPDLADRLKNNLPLAPYDPSKFYVPLANDGYINYPSFGKEADHSKDSVEPQPLA